MNQPETCGQGLAERSAVPAKLGALSAAMAENLEEHQRTLDLTDDNATAERDAYEVVASALRDAAAQLQTAADRMVGYKGLPTARHDMSAMRSPAIRDAFAKLIERERDLSALLNTVIQQDRAMLGGEPVGADSSGDRTTVGNAERAPLTHVPISRTGMLIRRPVGDVFEAIVNPEITTNFWFTRASGRLEVGKRVQWEWEMYDVSIQVIAKAIEPNRRIVIEWPGYSGPTTVEWKFTGLKSGTTFVSITESGFTGTGDELVKYVADSTQGFALLLAGLKAFLEHAVRLNLTADRYPAGVEEQEVTNA
jgi:uncharacterized protein YndB with AHSA1/START domain